jgi:hypothetical protein
MPLLQVAAGLFALVMLVRHVPRALQALRDPQGDRPGRAAVHITNVLLALAILAMAILSLTMKGRGGTLIWR